MTDQKNIAETLSDIDKAAGLQPGANVAPGNDVFNASDLPPGGHVSYPQNQQQLAGMLSGVLFVTFGLLAKKRGGHWLIDESAADEAGVAYAAVITKYFPDFSGGPEVVAIGVTLALVGPRVMQDKINEAQKQQQAASDGTQP